MNLRKTLLAGALTLGLLGSIAAPAAFAVDTPTIEDTVYVTVGVGTGGSFDAYFCAEHAYPLAVTQEPTAFAPGYAHGQLAICYDDTLNYRGSFRAVVDSSNFTASGTAQNTPIPASNLAVVRTYNVLQDHFSSETNYEIFHNHPGKIADIGFYVNNAYPSSQSGAPAWTSNNTLDEGRTVNFSWNGIGTVSSTGYFDVTLTIPGGTAPGAYASTLTLTLVPAPEHIRPAN